MAGWGRGEGGRLEEKKCLSEQKPEYFTALIIYIKYMVIYFQEHR
jgi:hypothetical protein